MAVRSAIGAMKVNFVSNCQTLNPCMFTQYDLLIFTRKTFKRISLGVLLTSAGTSTVQLSTTADLNDESHYRDDIQCSQLLQSCLHMYRVDLCLSMLCLNDNACVFF